LAIDDASGLTDMELRARVRRFASRHGLGIVFVDYLQLLSSHGKVENRNLEVGAMARGLKALAKDLNVPMVLLSQLSRDSAKTHRRPSKHDLRDSGELEQHADVVILLHRVKAVEDGQSSKYQDGELVELIVDKQRNGPLGVIPLQWIGSQVRFVERETQRVSA
jgi:replicative DNA helicase